MAFLEWFAEAENREELAEIRRHLRCTPVEAATLLLLGQLTEAIDSLGAEVAWLAANDHEEPDE